MQFAGDIVQPLLHLQSLFCSGDRGKRRVARLVGDVLHNDRAFRQHVTIIKPQRGYCALGINSRKSSPSLVFLEGNSTLARSNLAPASSRTMWGDSEQAPGA